MSLTTSGDMVTLHGTSVSGAFSQEERVEAAKFVYVTAVSIKKGVDDGRDDEARQLLKTLWDAFESAFEDGPADKVGWLGARFFLGEYFRHEGDFGEIRDCAGALLRDACGPGIESFFTDLDAHRDVLVGIRDRMIKQSGGH